MPSEFWAMTADEFLTLVEFENEDAPVKSGGRMTRRDVQRMVCDLNLTDEEWWAKNGASKG